MLLLSFCHLKFVKDMTFLYVFVLFSQNKSKSQDLCKLYNNAIMLFEFNKAYWKSSQIIMLNKSQTHIVFFTKTHDSNQNSHSDL